MAQIPSLKTSLIAASAISLMTLGFVAPAAVADGAAPGSSPVTNSCSASQGDLPTITSVTVDNVAIPFDTVTPGKGKLYATVIVDNGQSDQHETCRWNVRLNRDYGDAGPSNPSWGEATGVAAYWLDHGTFAANYGTYDIAAEQALSPTSVVEVKATLPASGTFSALKYYQLKSQTKLAGDNPVTLSGNDLTVVGNPSFQVKLASRWPNCFPADGFNALVDPKRTEAYYTDTLGCNLSNGGNAMGSDRIFSNGTVTGAGGDFANNFESGLMYGFGVTYSSFDVGTDQPGYETQRGMWFEADNTPQWSLMYGNQPPSFTIGMGNVHFVKEGAANTEVVNSGNLRFMITDAWASLAFGVTSASAPDLIAGTIKVVRTEAGSSSEVAATTTAVPGIGIVLEVGKVTYSAPSYKTEKSTAMTAKKKGSKYQLKISVPAGKSGKMGIYAVNKGAKGKKVATVKVKKSTMAKGYKVTVKKAKQGYYAKIGSSVIGSISTARK